MVCPDRLRLLSYLLLAAFLAQAYSLECFTCDSEFNCPQQTVRCKDGQNWCRAVGSQFDPVNDTQWSIRKGCAWREGANQTTSFSSIMYHLVQTEYFCGTNLCNREDPAKALGSLIPNGFQCHACIDCNMTDNTVQNCTGLENQCVSESSSFFIGGVKTILNNRGCFYNPSCTAPVGYHTSQGSALYECCNSSLCNNATIGFLTNTQPSNGVKCFSCVDVNATGCSPQNQNETECFGPLSMCMEAAIIDEFRKVTLAIKGCATPAWCHQATFKAFQLNDFQRVRCCQGNLCNGQEKPGPKTDNNGARSSAGLPQFTAALLLLSTSWNLMMFTGF